MILFFALFGFCLQNYNDQSGNHASSTTMSTCDSIPDLNQHILDYVTVNIGHKVGRGECWDLAASALNINKAKWDGRYNYGKKLDKNISCVYPGDIIQFERVVIEHRKGNSIYREEMPHHTAIIYEVKAQGNYIIAQQNYGNVRKVMLTLLKLEDVKRGEVLLYRPVK